LSLAGAGVLSRILAPLIQHRRDVCVAADIAKAANEPLIKALSEGVATIYNNYR
jgi:hypothetical protein